MENLFFSLCFLKVLLLYSIFDSLRKTEKFKLFEYKNELLQSSHLWVNEKKSSQSDTCFFNQNSIVSWDLLVEIGRQRIFKTSEATLLTRLIDPGQVGKVRISRYANHFAIDVPELLYSEKRNTY